MTSTRRAASLAIALALLGAGPASARFLGAGSDPDEAAITTAGNNGVIGVEAPGKDGARAYSIDEGSWHDYRAPRGVRTRLIAGFNFIATMPEGDRITQLAAFSDPARGWVVLELPAPAEGKLWGPVIGPSIAVYVDGRRVYAYSGPAGKWGALELPEGADPTPIVSARVATVRHGDVLHIFNAKLGRWDSSAPPAK